MNSQTRAELDSLDRTFAVRLLLAIILAAGLIVENVRADRLIGGGLFNLADLDPSTGAESFVIDLPLYDYWNSNLASIDSIEKHPVSEKIYGILRDNPNTLFTIDPATGEITVIGSTGEPDAVDGLTSITFGPGPDHLIYAIKGGSSEDTGTIWTVNPVSAMPTETGWTTAGTGGHALEFNPDDGLLYHFYSTVGADGLEKIDPATGVAVPVVLSGDSFGVVSGIVYAGSNLFYAYDNVNGAILSITTAGVVSVLSTSLDDSVEALDYVGPNLLAVDGAGVIFQYDPATGNRSSEVSVGIFEKRPSSISSIAKDSATNDYYVITEKDDPLGGDNETANSLAMIDIETGAFFSQVHLSSWGVTGITVGPLGQLYGVVDQDAPLGNGTIVAIDKVTGVVTDTGWASNQNAGDHCLEYHPDDGLLYHFYSDQFGRKQMETIDPDTGDVVTIGATTDGFPFGVVGLVYRGNDLFYVLDSAGFIHSVTSGGEALGNSSGIPGSPFRGLELGPDRVDIALEKAKLKRQIRKVKKAIRKAKQRGQKSKVRTLTRKLRKLKRELQAL